MDRRRLLGVAALTPLIARLPAEAGEVGALFNGMDLSGWTFDLQDPNAKPEDVWSVKDGLLRCTGRPAGVIRTEKSYGDVEITVEWRWPQQGGNNGLLIFCSTPRHLGIWPKSLEVQLAAGNAGDFWTIGESITIADQEKRQMGRRHLNLTDDSEKPVGEWNQMVVRCRKGNVLVTVNGVKVNEALTCTATSGNICLQSEGTPIEFRRVEARPL